MFWNDKIQVTAIGNLLSTEGKTLQLPEVINM